MKRKIRLILLILLSFLISVLMPDWLNAQNASDAIFAADSLSGKCQIVFPQAKDFKSFSKTDEEFSKVLGEQRVLVVLVEFPDAPRLSSVTPEKVEQMMFYDEFSPNAFFQNNSQNRIWLTGKALDWRMLPKTTVEYGIIDAHGEFTPYPLLSAIAGDTVNLVDSEINWKDYDRLIIIASRWGGYSFGDTSKLSYQTDEGTVFLSGIWTSGEYFTPDFFRNIGDFL